MYSVHIVLTDPGSEGGRSGGGRGELEKESEGRDVGRELEENHNNSCT